MELRAKQTVLILLVAILAFAAIEYGLYQTTAVSKGIDIMGTDPFMRLVRVEELHENGSWYDSTIDRSNAPYGDELHWTRPLDLILHLPALAGSMFVPYDVALYNVGIWISVILGCFCLCIILWMPGNTLQFEERPLMLLVFLTQPIMLEMFKFGRPDHHSLMLLLFTASLGGALRLIQTNDPFGYEWILGFFLSACIWVSVEAVVLVMFLCIAFGLDWIIHNNGSLQKLSRTLGFLCLGTGVFILVEKPVRQFFRVEYDKISVVYAVFFLILWALTWATQKLCARVNEKINAEVGVRTRLAVLTILALVGASIMILAFPAFIKGPFAEVNPAIGPIWLDLVKEIQPLWDTTGKGIGKMILNMGLPVASSVYMLLQMMRRKDATSSKLLLAVGFVLYGALSLKQLRWLGYLHFLTLIPTVLLLADVFRSIDRGMKGLLRVGLKALMITLVLFGFTAIGIAIVTDESKPMTASASSSTLRDLSEWLNHYEADSEGSKIILTNVNDGPELLYRTDYKVIAAPYHRNDAGILYVYETMRLSDPEKVQAALLERQVQWILIKPSESENLCYGYTLGNGTFYDQLVQGQVPAWLRQQELPSALNEYKLFEFKP